MRKLPFALALAPALVGCSSYEIAAPAHPVATIEAQPGLAEVCVVRPHALALLVPTVLHDNGRLVGGTVGESYFCYPVEPGLHRIVAESGDDLDRALGTANRDAASLEAVPGRRYYLHQSIGNLYGVSGLQWVDAETGRAMIARCDYKQLTAVPGSERLPEGEPVPPAAP